MEALGEPWGHLGRAWGGLGGALGGARAVLEVYKRRLEGLLGRLGAVLGALEAMMEPSGGQKPPKMHPPNLPNQAPEKTRAESSETLFFNDGTQDFNDFTHLKPSFWRSKYVQNGFRIASSTRNASESLLTGMLDAIIALLGPSWPLLNAS